MKSRKEQTPRPAFSLIEVALAVGIIGFAVIAILALFGTSLQSGRQVVDEDEALGVARALPAYLQTVGFPTVYHWIQSPSAAPNLYSYTILPSPLQAAAGDTAQQSVIYSGSDPGLTAPATTYLGRTGALFAIQLRFSADMPIHSGTAANAPLVAQPAPSMLPQSDALYPEPALAIRAAIYPVSTISLTGTASIPAGAYPAFADDIVVSR